MFCDTHTVYTVPMYRDGSEARSKVEGRRSKVQGPRSKVQGPRSKVRMTDPDL